MRLVPTRSASSCWVHPSAWRRRLTLRPTCLMSDMLCHWHTHVNRLDVKCGALRHRACYPDPTPPIVRIGPARLLYLQPCPRETANVRTGLVLSDHPLVAALYDLFPCIEPMRRQPTHRQHKLATG